MVVATPGRLLDHMRFSYVDLSAVEIVVLDEADRMLDMGFLPDIQRILAALPKKRQTLLFSATMSPTIRKLADEILRDPVTVTVDRQAPARRDRAERHAGRPGAQGALLSTLLRRDGMDSVLVFVRRKIDADRLARAVTRGGVDADQHPLGPQPGRPHRRARRLSQRPVPGADRHRRCGARPRRDRHLARDQLRRAALLGGLHPPRRTHGARRRDRRRDHVRRRPTRKSSSARSSASSG